MKYLIFLLVVGWAFPACNNKHREVSPIINLQQQIAVEAKKLDPKLVEPINEAWTAYFDSLGLVKLRQRDSSIVVHLVYSTADNFTGKPLYRDLKTAWLRPEAAEMLIKAQRLLKQRRPDLSLIVYDATRPFRIQRDMWNVAKNTDMKYYVANPNKGGGLHNYGMAVDVSLVNDSTGQALPMGTSFDYPGVESYITNEDELLKNGKITRQEYDNRRLLRQVMKEAGFRTVTREWWHFNACSLDEARQKYRRIE